MPKKIALFVLMIFICRFSFAQTQEKTKESSSEIYSCPVVAFSAAFVFPGADMQSYFGPFWSFGVNPFYKTNKNWLWGLEANMFFGDDNLKSDKMLEILSELYTDQNFIISSGGVDAGVVAYNRGYMFSANAGKLFPVTKKNQNSGIVFTFGTGYYQNQIIYQVTADQSTPQIEGDYAKGYDRQARGFQMNQFLGYMYMNNTNKFINFHVGLELVEAWSWSTRDYIFDLHAPDNSTHFDLMYNIKATWMFRIGKGKSKDYYYY